jgi:hypothetical protein
MDADMKFETLIDDDQNKFAITITPAAARQLAAFLARK